jgi:hypothetical protein
VPLTDGGFVICSATGAPVLGRLGGACLERMHAVRARLHAEHDMAVEQRRSRSARDRPWTPRLYTTKRRASGLRAARPEVRS